MKKTLLSVSMSLAFGMLFVTNQVEGQSILENTKMRFFAHGGYTLKNDKPATGADKLTHAFNSGGFNFFTISQITEKISYVGELFLGYKGDGADHVDFNIERSYVKYAVNDYLNVSLGRLYIPLGYWNSKYNQGMVYQPTINRPYITRNQNDKGIISSTGNGLQLSGENIGKLKFSYFGFIGNTAGAPSLNTDNVNSKAFTGKVKIEPINNLQVFVSAHSDFIKKGAKSISGTVMKNDVSQTIFNGGVAYFNSESPIELAAEYFQIYNTVSTVGTGKNTGAYAYLGYRVKNFTPYLQADLLEYDKKDAYFTINNLRGMAAGFRYNFSSNAVLKMEYKYRTSTKLLNQDVVSIQFALGF